MTPTHELPLPVRDKLSSARLRLRTVDIGLGSARAVLALSVAAVLLFALDTTLEPPLLVLRAFALFSALVAAAAATMFMYRPLSRPLSDDDVALLVEAEYPELEDGLVSTVQLARQLDRPDVYTSRALIRSTIARTATRVATVDFGRVVRTGPLVPLWVLIASFVGLGGLILSNASMAEYVHVFVRRVVFNDAGATYPKLVQLRILLSESEAVAKGDDLTVDVLVEKGRDLVETLSMVTAFDKTLERRELLKVGAGHYRKTYQNITEGFTLWAEDEVHGVASSRCVVRVVQRPRVEGYEFALAYPVYTGRVPESVTQPDLQVPTGTEIVYAVVTNKPLKAATLQFEHDLARPGRRPEGPPPEAPEAPATPAAPASTEGPPPRLLGAVDPAALAPGGELATIAPSLKRLKVEGPEFAQRVLVGHFRVSKDVRFHFALTSTEGYGEGAKPVVFTVRAVVDQRPIVSIPIPGRRKQVTPQAKMPLVVEAHDDYGVVSVVLRLRPETPGQAERPVTTLTLPGLVPGSKQARLNWILDVADLRLAPGDVLHYLAVASDQNIDESLRARESREYEVQVVRPEDLERILQDRLTALKERLEAAAKEENEAKTATDAFVGELGPKDVFSEDDKRRLQRFEQDQRRVTQRIDDVKTELADIKLERELNRLPDEAARGIVADLLDAVRDLAERASPAVSRELDDARQAAKVDERVRTRVARVPDLQAEIAAKLQQLAARIGKWGDFTEVIQDVRDLLQGQDRVMDGTRKAAQDEHH